MERMGDGTDSIRAGTNGVDHIVDETRRGGRAEKKSARRSKFVLMWMAQALGCDPSEYLYRYGYLAEKKRRG